MFQLREIVNQMEREACQYLEWGLNIDPAMLKEFKDMVCKDFPPHHPPPYRSPSHLWPHPLPSNEQWYSSPNAQYVPSLPSFNLPPETPLPS